MLHETIQNNQKWSSHHQPKQCMPRNDALQQLPVPLLQSLSRFCFRDTKRPQGLPAEGVTLDTSEKVCRLISSTTIFQHFPNDRFESFLSFTESATWLSEPNVYAASEITPLALHIFFIKGTARKIYTPPIRLDRPFLPHPEH